MQYIATVHFNTNRDHWFGYRDEHVKDLVRVPVWPAVHGDTPEAAAEAVFSHANKMTVDDDGAEWPAYVRSLSVGDVVILGGEADPVTGKTVFHVLAVESTGWKVLDYDAFVGQVPDQPNEDCWRRLFEAGAAVRP